MQIRRLIEGDEEAACQLVEQVKFAIDQVEDVSLDPADMRTLLADERAYLVAAYVDDRPAGLVYGYRFPRLDGPRPMMFLYEAGVLEQYRRRGVGRALVEELKRFAQESDCRKMFVPTQASKEAAGANASAQRSRWESTEALTRMRRSAIIQSPYQRRPEVMSMVKAMNPLLATPSGSRHR